MQVIERGDSGLAKGFLAAAASGLTLMLAGCGGDRTARTQTNAPPKPPNCRDTAGLSDVTLADGTIVDVRIITNGEITFYVPGYWYSQINDRPSIDTDWIKTQVNPFVDYEECPGVVHQWVTKAFDGGYRFSFLTPGIDRARGRAPQHFSLESVIDRVSFGRPWESGIGPLELPESLKAKAFDPNVDQIPYWNSSGTLETPKAHIVIVPGKLYAQYRWFGDKPIDSHEWDVARESVKDFAHWLMTPPNERDNDRVFKLGLVE